jgi:cold shock CspA family protein
MAGTDPSGPMSSRRPHHGVVHSFDELRGMGVVETDGGRHLPFHCTAIADGTRRIEVGAVVALIVVAGALGRLEAQGLLAERQGSPGR